MKDPISRGTDGRDVTHKRVRSFAFFLKVEREPRLLHHIKRKNKDQK
jgi:hypothetical protein